LLSEFPYSKSFCQLSPFGVANDVPEITAPLSFIDAAVVFHPAK
jgi:hypothetical protein